MKWKFFFDGACHLCSREVEHYQKLPGSEKIEFIDIAAVSFSAKEYGLDPITVNKEMHVISPEGKVFKAVDAVIEIWKVIPKYRIHASVAKQPPIKAFLKIGYVIFANLRPYLPKRKGACEVCVNRSGLAK